MKTSFILILQVLCVPQLAASGLKKRNPSEKCLEQVCESNAISLLGHKFVTFVVPRMETNNEN